MPIWSNDDLMTDFDIGEAGTVSPCIEETHFSMLSSKMVKSKGTFPNFRIRLFCKSFLCIVTKLIQVRLFYHIKVQGGVFRLPLLSQEPYHNTK